MDGINVYDLDDMACFFLFLLLLFGILESSLVFFLFLCLYYIRLGIRGVSILLMSVELTIHRYGFCIWYLRYIYVRRNMEVLGSGYGKDYIEHYMPSLGINMTKL